MKYIVKRDGRYYYSRRVPDLLKEFDPRNMIRVALKTDSKEQAKFRAATFNKEIEAYWQNLINSGETHSNKKFIQVVRTAHQMGFAYIPAQTLAMRSGQEIRERLKAVNGKTQHQIEAVLGGIDLPEINLQSALTKFWDYSKDRLLYKSDDQIRKWKNPRIKAINNFISICGNKKIQDIKREDIFKLKNWWLDRIQNDNKNPSSANKDIIHLKNVLETVSDNLNLDLDIGHLFKKIMFKQQFYQTRQPFTSIEILNILFNPFLKNLDKKAQAFLFVAAETGVRPSEIVGLLPEDISLESEIPHIKIVNRKDKVLKTPHSQREIPLIGYALDIFKTYPQGFCEYRDKPDNLSNMLNKFLRDNHLFPSDNHSVYSLRHSFQDRILSVDTPDRIQAELMGHKFNRPKYGDGATLEHKKQWMDKISLKTKEKANGSISHLLSETLVN